MGLFLMGCSNFRQFSRHNLKIAGGVNGDINCKFFGFHDDFMVIDRRV